MNSMIKNIWASLVLFVFIGIAAEELIAAESSDLLFSPPIAADGGIQSLIANVSLEISSPQMNFVQILTFKQFVKSPNKMRTEYDGNMGVVCFDGKTMTFKSGAQATNLGRMAPLTAVFELIRNLPTINMGYLFRHPDAIKKITGAPRRQVYTVIGNRGDLSSGPTELDIDVNGGKVIQIRNYNFEGILLRQTELGNYILANGHSVPNEIRMATNASEFGISKSFVGPLETEYRLLLQNVQINSPINDDIFSQ